MTPESVDVRLTEAIFGDIHVQAWTKGDCPTLYFTIERLSLHQRVSGTCDQLGYHFLPIDVCGFGGRSNYSLDDYVDAFRWVEFDRVARGRLSFAGA